MLNYGKILDSPRKDGQQVLESDNRVAFTTNTSHFITAAQNGYPFALLQREEAPDITATLSDIGYQNLPKLAGFGIKLRINGPLEDGYISIEKDYPEDLQNIFFNRARLLSAITGSKDFTLLCGNPRNTNFHIHFGPTLIGSILQRGPEWEKPDGSAGKVAKGDDLFVAGNQKHRSPVLDPNEDPEDEVRFMWAIGVPKRYPPTGNFVDQCRHRLARLRESLRHQPNPQSSFEY